MGRMTTYLITGIAIGCLALAPGMVVAGDDATFGRGGERFAGIVLAVIWAVAVGAVWPLALLAAAICTGIGLSRRRRAARVTSPGEPAPADDALRYRNLALYQRKLARYARRDGMPDVAASQDGLADSYDTLSKVYDRD